MISPILVVNPAGEYMIEDWVAYSYAINNCSYLDKLFNNKAIVMDRCTLQYIEYDRYNSLPILFDHNYCTDMFGVISIHSLDVLYDYSKKYCEDTFIISCLYDFYKDINSYAKLYLLCSESLKGQYGDDETQFIDYTKWMRKNYPIYQDDISTIYCFVNVPKIIGLYSIVMGRPLYEYEKKIIIDNYTSYDSEVQVPPYFPMINI